MSRIGKIFTAALLGIFGTEPYKVEKGAYSKPKQNRVKGSSINGKMKLFRDHGQGTMSRRIARKLVKLVNQDDKKTFRIAERKSDPERHMKFARA